MDIVIVGPGRAGSALAARLGIAATRDVGDAIGAEVTVLAVPDAAIATCAASLPADQCVGMLSGATPIAALGAREHAFVLHPLQTLTGAASAGALTGTPATVTGTTAHATAVATAVAEACGLDPVPLPEAARPLPHLACVFASNYLVTLLAAARVLLDRSGLGERGLALLAPLIEETVRRAVTADGPPVPTGPVARGDVTTIEEHLRALEHDAPDLVTLYRALAVATLPLVPPAAAADVGGVLEVRT